MKKYRKRSRKGLWAAIICFAIGGACMACGIRYTQKGVVTSSGRLKTSQIPYQEITVEEAGLAKKFYYQQTAEKDRTAYKEILQGVRGNTDKIYLHEESAERANELFQYVLDDFPELFWCDGNATATFYPGILGKDGYVVLEPTYIYSGEEKDEKNRQIEENVEACLSEAPQDAEEYTKIKYIYEYLINTVDYDLEAPDNQNILSALVNRSSVCAGYARGTQYLLERMGIYCTYVTGKASGADGLTEDHAWNLVQCNGQYYYVDTTWGDPVFQKDVEYGTGHAMTYDYLCCSEQELFKTHTITPGFSYPECKSDDLNYYKMNGMFYDAYDEDVFLNVIYRSVEAGDGTTIFKFSDDTLYTQAYNTIIGDLVVRGAQYLGSIYGMEEIHYSYEEDPLLHKITLYWIYE